ncbi:IS200/IS605 family transposase [Salmonella enterica subsp. enterica serovar Nigeria]|nr:IS200/IS605 family transposase [Salmonella enterica subsp. enterica serovar Nigeria]
MDTMLRWKVVKSRFTAHLLHINAVFLVNKRKQILDDSHIERLYECVCSLCGSAGVQVGIEGTGRDYVHFIFIYPPTLRLNDFISNVKSVSSRRLRDEFPDLVRESEDSFWSRYHLLTSAGGPAADIIKKYIITQRA